LAAEQRGGDVSGTLCDQFHIGAVTAVYHAVRNDTGEQGLYEISNKLPAISLPAFSLTTVQNVLPDAFTIAILAAIESLLSCIQIPYRIDVQMQTGYRSTASNYGDQGSGNAF